MKRILLLAVFAIFSQVLCAQIHFGPKIGYTTSKLSVDRSEISTDLKSSFTFGAFVRLGTKIYVQPEINFQTLGGVYKNPDMNSLTPFKQEVNLKSFEIPVMVGYRIANLGVANIRLMAGPTASIVIDKTIKNKVANYEQVLKDTDINDVLWGLQIGAGVDVLMFTLDVRYNIGLSNVIKNVDIGGNPIKFDSKANVFTVGLGWKIL